VVAAARRSLRERRIGHTGTLDPLATGVLPLACGRATRLVRFLTASDKAYDAAIAFGRTTDTDDVTGEETSRSDRQPEAAAVERALAWLTGTYLQVPPAFSAKKVGGRRAYELARRDEPVVLAPVSVTVARASLLAFDGRSARVAISCSAGFYVRAFARALGELVGTGAHLEGLRRTRSGDFDLSDAVALANVVEDPAGATHRLIPMEHLLPGFPAVRLSPGDCIRASHGQEIDRTAATDGVTTSAAGEAAWYRLLDPEGRLIALAEPGQRAGSLHPAVVLI
jgi:tRNA pseudouridine55 synthase